MFLHCKAAAVVFWRRLLFISLVCASSAHAQSVVEQAKDFLRQGNPAAAYAILEPASDQLNDAESAYFLGIAALDTGRSGLAVIAFERALTYDPNFAPARAELVRALIATGEVAQARAELARLASVSLPEHVVRKLKQLEVQLTRRDLAQQRKQGISGYVLAELGYDSNINTGASSPTFAVPLFGSATVTLNQLFLKQGSGFAGLGAGAVGFKDIDTEYRLFAGVDVRGRYNFRSFDGDHFGTVTWSGNAGIRWQRGSHTITGAASVLENSVGSTTFDRQWGLYGQYHRQIGQSDEVGLFGQWLDQHHPILPSLDTRLSLIGVGWRRALGGEGSAVLTLTGYYGDDRERGNDPAVGRSILGGRIGLVRHLGFGADLVATLTHQKSEYRGENIFFMRKREDDRSDVFLGLVFTLAKDLTLTPQYIYTRNHSNIPVVDFTRHQVLAVLRRDF